MREPTRTRLQVVAVVCFVVGLMVFLNETRSTGEAPQTFELIISSSTASLVGAALALIAATFGVLFLLERKQRHKSQEYA